MNHDLRYKKKFSVLESLFVMFTSAYCTFCSPNTNTDLINCSDVFPYGIYMLTYDYVVNMLGDIHYEQEKRLRSHESHIDMFITVAAGALAGTYFILFTN